jgi:hypothetical protein
MDTLHTVLRSIREDKSRRDHLDVFREFLSHLDRIGRSANWRAPSVKRGKANTRLDIIMLISSDTATPRASIAADGTVEGYASLFGAIDQANDMVMPGAFAQTLRERDIRRIPMLFQHDPAEPVGIWLELKEDWLGLFVRGRLIPEVARARELLALLRAGGADGLSIGFRTVKGRVDPRTRVRRLHQVDLWEISLVTFPLLAGARVRSVKSSRFDPEEWLWRRHPRLSFTRSRTEEVTVASREPARHGQAAR